MNFQVMLIYFLSFPPLLSFLSLKMQELEQRVIEAEQRAEDAEKQVRDSDGGSGTSPAVNSL